MTTREIPTPPHPRSRRLHTKNGRSRIEDLPWRRRALCTLSCRRTAMSLAFDRYVHNAGTLVQLFCEELRSLRARMQCAARGIPQYLAYIELPYYQAEGPKPWRPSLETAASSAGITSICAMYPWASIGDLRMFVAGWKLATQWNRYIASSAGRAAMETSQNLTDEKQILELYDQMLHAAGLSSSAEAS